MRPLIGIYIPTYGTVSIQWASARANMGIPLGSMSISAYDSTNKNIAEKRNSGVFWALQNNVHNLLFLGDDNLPPADMIIKMLDHVRRGRPVITGLYFSRSLPLQPMIWKDEYMQGGYWDWHIGDILQIYAAGCDALMINMDAVKDKIEFPWFDINYRLAHEEPKNSNSKLGIGRVLSCKRSFINFDGNYASAICAVDDGAIIVYEDERCREIEVGGKKVKILLPHSLFAVIKDYDNIKFNHMSDFDIIIDPCKEGELEDVIPICEANRRAESEQSPLLTGKSYTHLTEDFYFYAKLKAAGIPVFCDTGIQVGHQDRQSGITYALPPDYPQAKPGCEIPRKKDILIADIGSGLRADPIHLEGDVVRFDMNPNCKPNVLCDVTSIPEQDNKYDIVLASHVLEHIPGMEAAKTLSEWVRILKVGGKIIVRVPNIKWAMKRILETKHTIYDLQVIYGMQTDSGQIHYNGFWAESLGGLGQMVTELGDLKISFTGPAGAEDSEITLTAIKTKSKEIPILSEVFDKDADTISKSCSGECVS